MTHEPEETVTHDLHASLKYEDIQELRQRISNLEDKLSWIDLQQSYRASNNARFHPYRRAGDMF